MHVHNKMVGRNNVTVRKQKCAIESMQTISVNLPSSGRDTLYVPDVLP